MEATPIQVDNVTSLPADDFNPIPREIENGIEAAGITLAADQTQLAKSMATHVGVADYYSSSIIASAYTLVSIAPFKQPAAYFLGMRVRFETTLDPAGTAVTIGIGALAAVPVHYGILENGGTPTVAANTIAQYELIEAVYSKTPDGLTTYWRVGTPLSKMTAGSAEIKHNFGGFDFTTTITESNVQYKKDIDSSYNNYAWDEFEQVASDSSRIRSKDGATRYADTVSATVAVTNNWQGTKYSGANHPTDDTTVAHNQSVEALPTTIAWTDPTASGVWVGGSYTTNVKKECNILGITARYTTVSATKIVSPVAATITAGATYWSLLPFRIINHQTGAAGQPTTTGVILTIHFDGQNLV